MSTARCVIAMHTEPRTIFFLVHFFLFSAIWLASDVHFPLRCCVYSISFSFFLSHRRFSNYAHAGISHGVAKKSNYEDLHNRVQHKLRVNETERKKKSKMKKTSVVNGRTKKKHTHQNFKLKQRIVSAMFDTATRRKSKKKKHMDVDKKRILLENWQRHSDEWEREGDEITFLVNKKKKRNLMIRWFNDSHNRFKIFELSSQSLIDQYVFVFTFWIKIEAITKRMSIKKPRTNNKKSSIKLLFSRKSEKSFRKYIFKWSHKAIN